MLNVYLMPLHFHIKYIKEYMSIYAKSPKVTITFIHRSKIVVQEMYGLVHIKSSKCVNV